MYVEQLTPLAGAVLWQTDPQPGSAVLPDGCMDLIWLNGQFVVAGPDTRPWHGSGAIRHASSDRGADRIVGLRFPAGVVPSLLGFRPSSCATPDDPWSSSRPAPRSAATKVGPLGVIRSGFCSS